MARRAARIAQERARGGFVLLLDAGDSLVGDQNPARKTKGQTSVTLMNMMAYDAMALGPKDLALGASVLRQRMAEADFAMLSANALDAATGERLAEAYILREFEGHKVAIVGLSASSPVEGISLRDPVEALQAVLAELAGRADVIIVLSHAGEVADQKIADTLPGIDLLVSGGAPLLASPWRSQKTSTPIVRADQAAAGHAGRRLGIGVLSLDAGGQVTGFKWQGVNLGPEIPDDPDMAAWVKTQSR